MFDFSELIEPFGQAFAERIGTAFLFIVSTQKSPKAYYQRILHFLLWIARQTEGFPSIVDRLRENKRPDEVIFERAVLVYQQELLADLSRAATVTEGQMVGPCFSVIEKFSKAKTLPRVRFRATGRRLRNSNRRHHLWLRLRRLKMMLAAFSKSQ